jgi:hypothetical protein
MVLVGDRVHSGGVAIDPDLYFELSPDELREVTRFAVVDAASVLPLFERDHADDDRPRAAIDAARLFAEGPVAQDCSGALPWRLTGLTRRRLPRLPGTPPFRPGMPPRPLTCIPSPSPIK